jgi:diguanylate cyclase (GGDEF)-like protein
MTNPIIKRVFDHDTGAFISEVFLFLLKLEIDRSIRYPNYGSILRIGLDGPEFADKEMKENVKTLASILRNELRKTDIIGRIDKHEFCVLLVNSDLDIATIVEERIRTMADYTFPALAGAKSRICLGAACFPKDATDLDGLLNKAQDRLQKSKNSPLPA